MEAVQVVEKILADAKAEAGKIKKQAEENEAAEQAKLTKQLDEYKKQTEILARKAGVDEESHILAAARMDIAKQLLAEKRKILDEVFEQAHEQLQNLPDEEYRTLCTKLMLETVETGEEEVVIDKNEKRINQELIDQVNQQLGSKGKGELKLSEQKQDIGAGFILKRGQIKTNVSLDVLLDQARKELEIDLAKELFKD
ncbi:MAG TPA: V-type ATP synthase subunit E family protein [Sedimentisphaerales bacterium]|nr:V-type ATP synthase subunit E family protein [Sedimentisphaerales bacterium]